MKNELKINAAITTAAVIVCAILINLIIGVIADKKPLQIDLTREKIYQFSEQTKSVMEGLSSEVLAYALYPEDASGEAVEYVKEYLKKYEVLSDKFTVEYINPYNDPNFVKQYEENGDYVDVGSIIVTCKDKFSVVNFNDLYTTNQYTNSTSIDMEKKMTSAIMNVTGADKGGRIMLVANPGKELGKNLASYIADWGVTLENDYIIENDPNHAYRSQYGGVYPAPIMQEHKITQSFIDQKLNFVAPMSRSITVKENNVFNAQHEILMRYKRKRRGVCSI